MGGARELGCCSCRQLGIDVAHGHQLRVGVGRYRVEMDGRDVTATDHGDPQRWHGHACPVLVADLPSGRLARAQSYAIW